MTSTKVEVWEAGGNLSVSVPTIAYDLESALVQAGARRTGTYTARSYTVPMSSRAIVITTLRNHGDMPVNDPENILGLPYFQDPVCYDVGREMHAYAVFAANGQGLQPAPTYGTARKAYNAIYAAVPGATEALGYSGGADEHDRVGMRTSAQRFWDMLLSNIGSVLRGIHTNEGLTEIADFQAFRTYWREVRQTLFTEPIRAGVQYYPPEVDMPWYYVAILGKTGGPAYEVGGTCAQRSFGLSPLRVGTTHVDCDFDGLHQSLVSWAAYEGRVESILIHASAVGPYQKLKALWAYIMNGNRNPIELKRPEDGYRDRFYAKREAGKQKYDVIWSDEPLPISRWAHMTIEHKKNNVNEIGSGDKGFFHLVGDHPSGAPDLEKFFLQLDRAVTVPMQPEWAFDLWRYGIQSKLIVRCRSFNCTAYVVIADERGWTKLVTALTLGITPEEVDTVTSVENIGGEINAPAEDFGVDSEDMEYGDEEEEEGEEA